MLFAIGTNIMFTSIFLKIATSSQNAFLHESAYLSLKVFQNWDFGKWLKKISVAVKSSQSGQNWHPLKAFFRVGSNQKSHGARSGL